MALKCILNGPNINLLYLCKISLLHLNIHKSVKAPLLWLRGPDTGYQIYPIIFAFSPYIFKV